jgi:PIN domain nuclease of toxin-antitoxin system
MSIYNILEKGFKSINDKSLFEDSNQSVHISFVTTHELVAKNAEGRIIDRLPIPVDSEETAQAYLQGFRTCLAVIRNR